MAIILLYAHITGGLDMKISVESYNNGNKISDLSKDSLPKIKNQTVLSIIDNAIMRNNELTNENKSPLFQSPQSSNENISGDKFR